MKGKQGDQCTWGNLREKSWLKEMVKKRNGTDRIDFLHKYRAAIPLRKDWGSMCPKVMTRYTDRLITNARAVQGGLGDNSGL